MIDESLARAPILDKDGYDYLIHPLTDGVPRVDPALLQAFVTWAKEQPETAQATLILAPEAMALPLATALSLATGIPFVCARKRQYGLAGEQVAYCETGYGEACIYINDVSAADRVLVVDDVLSTGGTMGGLLAALADTGATTVAALLFLDKADAAAGLRATHGIPVRAMRSVRIKGGKVVPA